MKSPLDCNRRFQLIEEVSSTQSLLADDVREGGDVGVLLARHQTSGRGRFDRVWLSARGDSLTMSMAFYAYADHPKPYLVGMAVAAATAGVLHCQLRWPNDLTFDGRKLGGILSEIVVDPDGRHVPVVGSGVNLNQAEFPSEIAEVATSLHRLRGGAHDPEVIARKILDRFADLPEPTSWTALEPAWSLFDHTPGKLYRLPNGEFALALGVGSDGQLIASVDGESVSVLAADAIFGATR